MIEAGAVAETGKLKEQVGGQLIPAGVLTTVPVPFPGFGLVTCRVNGLGGGAGPKFAPMVMDCVMVTVQSPVPGHDAPGALAVFQPVNTKPVRPKALSVTTSPVA